MPGHPLRDADKMGYFIQIRQNFMYFGKMDNFLKTSFSDRFLVFNKRIKIFVKFDIIIY